jgi:hypothetical protein
MIYQYLENNYTLVSFGSILNSPYFTAHHTQRAKTNLPGGPCIIHILGSALKQASAICRIACFCALFNLACGKQDTKYTITQVTNGNLRYGAIFSLCYPVTINSTKWMKHELKEKL